MFDIVTPSAAEAPLLAVLLAVTIVIPLGAFAASPHRFTARLGPEGAMHLHRGVCALLFGAIPLAVAVAWGGDPWSLGLALPDPAWAAVFAVAMPLVAGPIIVLSSRGQHFRANYPAIRGVGPWDVGLVVRNLLSWSIYLFGYELLFRGVLLFTLARAFGAWPALAISTLAYVWQHLPKNGREAAATLPVGLVFGIVALQGGGIWAPLVAHIVIANLGDLVAAPRGAAPDR